MLIIIFAGTSAIAAMPGSHWSAGSVRDAICAEINGPGSGNSSNRLSARGPGEW